MRQVNIYQAIDEESRGVEGAGGSAGRSEREEGNAMRQFGLT